MHTDYFLKQGYGTYKVHGLLLGRINRAEELKGRLTHVSRMQVSSKIRNMSIIPFRRVRRIAESDYELRHVCLSIRLSARNTDGFSCNLICEYFSNICQENSDFIKI
jgi:hypothetical protein